MGSNLVAVTYTFTNFYHILSPSNNFYYLPSIFTIFYHFLYYFYQCLPIFTTFHQILLPSINFYFYTSFTNVLPSPTNFYQLFANFYQYLITSTNFYATNTSFKNTCGENLLPSLTTHVTNINIFLK